jgi:HD-GYP domain-containing protein (c-di-GMP phosphodiesterase class II)
MSEGGFDPVRPGRRFAGTRTANGEGMLLRAIAERDGPLREHSDGVARVAQAVGRRLGLTADQLDLLDEAAQLHDVGKLAIADRILSKPGPLDPDEWARMSQHTVIGQRILEAEPELCEVGAIIRSCHERYDGFGYPDGLRGDAIPLASRIIAACDAFDAMTSARPYRRAMSVAEAIGELTRCAGSQFDPLVVAVICELLERRPPHR